MKQISVLLFIFALAFSVRAQAPQPYLVADFAEKDLPAMLDLCRQSGIDALVVRNPFSTFGHYEWNGIFAPEGNKSVKRMVKTAQDQGVTLGVMVQEEVISTNDAYFAPKYFGQYQHSEALTLFDEMGADDVDIALRRNDAVKNLSSLNLLRIDDELVSIGTMEFAGDLVLLHHCTRGMYGTRRVTHGTKAKVVRIWDTPDQQVIPTGELREAVRQQLADRLEAVGITLAIQKGAPGQEFLDESIRVRQVERWESEGVGNTIGWFVIRAADKHRAATTVDDVQWMLSKAAAYNAGYGLLIDPKAMKHPGALSDLLAVIRQWNTLTRDGAFTAAHQEAMKDPYLDWNLEQRSEDSFLLYPLHFSRRFQCDLQPVDTGLLQSETWNWNAEEEGPFGLRLQVEGEVDVINPMVNTSRGLMMLACTVKPGQKLAFDFKDTAWLLDANGNKLETVAVEGLPELAKGDNEVNFFCEVDPEIEKQPMVKLRYITRDPALVIHPHK